MEDLGVTADFWRGRRVLVTGHTGFKGSWLTAWLEHLGADVHGISLEPVPGAMYEKLHGWKHSSTYDDLRTADLDRLVREISPEVVLYLAAQAVVLTSYEEPERTFSTNVMGTVRLLNALRNADELKSIVVITSDKVYGDRHRDFSESDQLSGSDPYSGSKVAQEAVATSFRQSYFEGKAGLVTARAGNVIGGGDAAAYRILPDCVRAIRNGKALTLRHPNAVRPWQHVLEPLRGYLMYAEAVARGPSALPTALNFAPYPSSTASVQTVVDTFLGAIHRGHEVEVISHTPEDALHETGHLTIDPAAAKDAIGWTPALDLTASLEWSAEWYSEALKGGDLRAMTTRQISAYEELVR